MSRPEEGTRYIRGHKVTGTAHRKPSEIWLAVGIVLWTVGTTGMIRLPNGLMLWVAGYSVVTILGVLCVCRYVGGVVRHLAYKATLSRRMPRIMARASDYWPEEEAWQDKP